MREIIFTWQTWLEVLAYVPQYLFYKSGGRLNKKDGLTRYGDSHVKDKTS